MTLYVVKDSRQCCQTAKSILAFICISSKVTTYRVIHTKHVNNIKPDFAYVSKGFQSPCNDHINCVRYSNECLYTVSDLTMSDVLNQ